MERPSVLGCGESKVMVWGGACYFQSSVYGQ